MQARPQREGVEGKEQQQGQQKRTVDASEELPGHVDRLDLEVIAKGPVSKHLEEGVMVRVLS